MSHECGDTTESYATSLAPQPVPGVALAAVKAGIRYPDRLDLVALRLAEGSRVAAMFTRNAFCAAPVTLAREHLTSAQPRLLLINTGNANAGTGASGYKNARHCCDAAATAAGLELGQVLPFSTGVIGEDLPVDRLVAALPELLAACAADRWMDAARGIMTTDTVPKAFSRLCKVGEQSFVLTGIAKGAGMLRPNMATMLAFLSTDAPLEQTLLDQLLAEAVEQSFHRITVDGDTSTNDAVVLAATGAGELVADRSHPLAAEFARALNSLTLELAKGLVRDGEGASKFLEIAVTGGASSTECLDVAFTIAHSPLVKTALFAGDPNWGRLLAAIGRSGLADLDVDGVRITIGELLIAENGARSGSYDEAAVAALMAERDVLLQIDLGRGDARETVWTCDLSYDYVRINAEYRS